MEPRDHARELLRLAEQDELAANVLGAEPAVGDGVIGFHYQQATEKLLKALLAVRNVEYPTTHNLLTLRGLVEGQGNGPPLEEEVLARLIPFAVTHRYPTLGVAGHLDRERVRLAVAGLRAWVTNVIEASGP